MTYNTVGLAFSSYILVGFVRDAYILVLLTERTRMFFIDN